MCAMAINQTELSVNRMHCGSKAAIISSVAGISAGEVSELADEHDLGSCAARREGSSPSFPTKATALPAPSIGEPIRVLDCPTPWIDTRQ